MSTARRKRFSLAAVLGLTDSGSDAGRVVIGKRKPDPQRLAAAVAKRARRAAKRRRDGQS